MSVSRHHWIRLSRPADPASIPALVTTAVPWISDHLPLLDAVSAHRRLLGPYTAARTIVRAVVPTAPSESVDRHQIELLSVAPELAERVQVSRETLTSLAVPAERTRFYSRLRTRRISHGIAEFLVSSLAAAGGGPRVVVVHSAEDADATDAEFLAVLLRRVDPDQLTIVVTSHGDVPEVLSDALDRYAHPCSVEVAPDEVTEPDDVAAARYVDSDGTLGLPGPLAAYHRLPPERRAELHERRAAALSAEGQLARLGALPYHLEHGADPAGAGADALRAAANHCVDMGFYDATIEFCSRGRALIDPDTQVDHWWTFVTKTTVSLAALGRAHEAAALYAETIASSANPKVHMQAAYAVGMIYTRHHEVVARDHVRAKGLLNQAIAFANLLFEGKERAFRVVFNRNGLALVEAHLGNLPEALRLVTEGLQLLDGTLELHEHQLHRSVLVHNRATVLAGLGRLEEAVAEFGAVIAVDPNYPDYYLDRGNALHRLGRNDEALADYETAIRLGPPFPEAQYNRAELLLDRGDDAAARAALDYVIVLDPDMVDAYVNRAGLLLDEGLLDEAQRDVDAGLALDPGNPHLLTAQGRVLADRGDAAAALAPLGRALTAAPRLVSALVARAGAHYELGDRAAALVDLDQAIEVEPDNAAVLFNRAVLHEEAGRPAAALADLRTAEAQDPGDPDVQAALQRLLTAVPA